MNSKIRVKCFRPFSIKQKQILTWWADGSPVAHYDGIIASGSIRSGKTMSMSLSFALWAMARFNGEAFGMAGKTVGSFRRNVVVDLKRMLVGRGFMVTDRRADNMIVVRRGDVENVFYIFGGKDEASQDLVQGVTLAGFFFDEVALMPESFVNQATGRCSVAGSKLWFNCNPEGPMHWFKKRWIDDQENQRMLYLHFTMDDNLSLTPETRERYMRRYTGVFYERFILGQWSRAEGLVYDMFDVDRHVVANPPERYDKTYIAVDYGTQNPTVFLKIGLSGGAWYVYDEYYYSGRETGRQKTDAAYADDLEDFTGGRKDEREIVDPSAASFIAALRERGRNPMSAKNEVLDGIRRVARAMTEGKIYIGANCTNIINEFMSYSWDPKAADRGEDVPIKENDHCMDALRYFINTITHGAEITVKGYRHSL